MAYIVSAKTGPNWTEIGRPTTALASRKMAYKGCKEYWTTVRIVKPSKAKFSDVIGTATLENGKVFYQPMSSHIKFPLRADGTIKW